MSIELDIQKLDPGAVVELFVIDLSMFAGGSVFYFHAGANDFKGNVTWQGNAYVPWPVEAKGFDRSSQGRMARPTLSISNVFGSIGALARQFDDLLGAKVTRKRTFVKYLDSANFPGSSNPSADPNQHFPDDIFYIDQKSTENKHVIEFTLAASFDLEGVKIPRRLVTKTCPWQYKGVECGYVPGAMFDLQDQPTTDPTKDMCGKRVGSCQKRFSDWLPFGGFPGAGLSR